MAGLSPRLRGNRLPTAFAKQSIWRVYPRVCGGTAANSATCNITYAWVYPRVCGGTMVVFLLDRSKAAYPRSAGEPSGPFMAPHGLSPRLRGNPLITRLLTMWRIPVYPRVCGGTNAIAGWQGSHTDRSIPASAGEPSSIQPVSCTILQVRSIPASAGEPQ